MCDNKCCSMFWCFLFLMSGVAFTALGMWMAADDHVYNSKVMQNPDLMNNKTPYNGSVGGIIVVGLYNFLVGILGMAGTGCDLDKKIHNSLIAFTVFASIGVAAVIICGSISAARFAKTNEADTLSELKDNLYYEYTNTSDNDLFSAWNQYQLEYRCCGVYNYADYQKSSFTNETGLPVPWTCCQIKGDIDPIDATGPEDVINYVKCMNDTQGGPPSSDGIQTAGCGAQHWDNYRMYQVIVLSMSWTSVFVQIVALSVAGCLRRDSDD